MGDAELLFDELNKHPQGMTLDDAQVFLIEHGDTGGFANIVVSVLRDMIPENVVIRRNGMVRLAQTFEDGKDWIFTKLMHIKRMSDNVERDIEKLIQHFPNSDMGNYLSYAMQASQLTSNAIANAIKLT
jgi:hypothetical protein